MINDSSPLVTCVTVSQPTRLSSLSFAIEDFSRQKWPQKELLVVVDDQRYCVRVRRLLERFDINTRIVQCASGLTLGQLRNIASEHACGPFICQWDDDDRYSAERVSGQMRAILSQNASACFLNQQLHYFEVSRQLFWTDWRRHNGVEGIRQPFCWIPGTALLATSIARYPEEGPTSVRGEDCKLAWSLPVEHVVTAALPPEVYLRVYHGNNTWDYQHHLQVAISHTQSAKNILQMHAQLLKAIEDFKLKGPISVMAGEDKVLTLGN